jgi:hypothetical protein
MNTILTTTDALDPETLFMAKSMSTVFARWQSARGGNPHFRAPGIHPSGVSHCLRKLVYSLNETEKRAAVIPSKPKPNIHLPQAGRLDIGTYVHDKLQRDLHRWAAESEGRISFESEIAIDPFINPVAKDLQIYGHADGIITQWEQHEEGPPTPLLRLLIEIKTAAPDKFDEYVKNGEPIPEHVEQAHVYMACLDVPLCWFICVDKSSDEFTSSTTGFLVPFNPKLWVELQERITKAWSHHIDGTLPPAVDVPHCFWCDYQWTCKPKPERKPAPMQLGRTRT